jgi:hypothetical protein
VIRVAALPERHDDPLHGRSLPCMHHLHAKGQLPDVNLRIGLGRRDDRYWYELPV